MKTPHVSPWPPYVLLSAIAYPFQELLVRSLWWWGVLEISLMWTLYMVCDFINTSARKRVWSA